MKLVGQMLSAMEIAANKTATQYSRYGSDTYKQVYLRRVRSVSDGFESLFRDAMGLGGWLLTPWIGKFGMETFRRCVNG